MLGDIAMKEEKDIYRGYKERECSKMNKYSSIPEHTEAINFILKFESVWNYFKSCIIAECEDCWIINGKIYKKEVIT